MLSAESSSKTVELIACSKSDNHHSVLVVIPERVPAKESISGALTNVSKEFRTFLLASPLPPVDQVFEYIEHVYAAFQSEKIKRATVCGIGAGATVAQGLALKHPKEVRRLVLLDATRRLAPGLVTRAIDKAERLFPLGLPLRRLTKEFDSGPFLHRIHCPTMILNSPSASHYEKEQAAYLSSKIPNSWYDALEHPFRNCSETFSEELQEHLRQFLQVPVKRPQKSRKKKEKGRKAA